MHEARRTLVKSPPEIWAEVSDPDALGRHLDAFGEIRITRLEPETAVAWEGDRASGTVALAPSGWGTKVTVTADPEQETAVEEPAAARVPLAAPPKRLGFFARLLRRPPPPPVEAAPEPVPAVPEPDPAAQAVLDGMLDRLGSAHHRPFSRG